MGGRCVSPNLQQASEDENRLLGFPDGAQHLDELCVQFGERHGHPDLAEGISRMKQMTQVRLARLGEES